MASKANKQIQTLYGIEAFVLCRDWVVNAKDGMSIGDFYLALDELHTASQNPFTEKLSLAIENEETKTLASEKIRKRYEPYLKNFKEQFGFDFSFKEKKVSAYLNHPNSFTEISKIILKDLCFHFSDDSLKFVMKNWNKPQELPSFLITTRYAIQFGFPIEFTYTKLMNQGKTHRKIFPYMITVTEGLLGVIGYDLSDKKTKSFLLSRISEHKPGFLTEFRKARSGEYKVPKFDYQKYLETDPSAKFQKKEITYRLQIAKTNLDLMEHSADFKIKILSEQTTFVEIEITTSNEWAVFDKLFNYSTYAKLLAPADAVQRFQNKLVTLSEYYGVSHSSSQKKLTSKKKSLSSKKS